MCIYNSERYKIFDEVIALVEEWQDKGRVGFCLPVIRGDLLSRIEELANERRTDNCSWCLGTGKINDGYENFDCGHCKNDEE